MAANILQEYLVSLGWSVDQAALRKFDDALKHMANQVERYTSHPLYGIAPMFVKAGLAVTGVLASITAGTIGLLTHTAQADLDFQVLARRMFMSADAAKQMKIATDALGYSLEDIIWGPPELRQRYHTLIEDQKRMNGQLGGTDFEAQMRGIRDVEFEFTRFKVELQYFGMQLAGTLAKALFGDHGDLLQNLQYMNQWFQEHIPEIANKVTTVLVPALNLVYHVLEDIVKVLAFVDQSPLAQKMILGAVVGGAAGSIVPGLGTLGGAAIGAMGGAAADSGFMERMTGSKLPFDHSADEYKSMARRLALANGLDPNIFAALINKESGWNPDAVNPKSGASGLGQLMPGNMFAFGEQGWMPEDNLDISAKLLSQYLRESGGDYRKALKKYGGFVNQDPSGYVDSIMNGARLHPSSYGGAGGGAGGNINVSVNVAGSNATAEEIANAAARKVSDAQALQNQRLFAQFGGVAG